MFWMIVLGASESVDGDCVVELIGQVSSPSFLYRQFCGHVHRARELPSSIPRTTIQLMPMISRAGRIVELHAPVRTSFALFRRAN